MLLWQTTNAWQSEIRAALVLGTRGQLLRRPHPEDGRAKALQTTAQAKELVNRAVLAVERCDAKFFGSQGPAFIEVLNRLPHRGKADA